MRILWFFIWTKLESPLFNDDLCQVWLKLAQWVIHILHKHICLFLQLMSIFYMNVILSWSIQFIYLYMMLVSKTYVCLYVCQQKCILICLVKWKKNNCHQTNAKEINPFVYVIVIVKLWIKHWIKKWVWKWSHLFF